MRLVLASVFFFLVLAPAHAQDQGVQRALIQRDQQSAAFALQLRHSQEALKVPPASRPELESRQLWERQRLENLNEKHLLEVRPETLDTLRPLERQRAGEYRCKVVSPIELQ